MKNTFRALFGVSALALLVVATPVMAAEVVDVNASNETTGNNSENDNSYDIENNVDADVDNEGTVTHTFSGTATTGGNEQSRNTTGGDLDSGDVDATPKWESVVNASSDMMDSDGDLEIEADFSNKETGNRSENENELDVEHNVDLELDNIASIVNTLVLSANTGDNEQSRNTTAGDLETGDVEVNARVMNKANNGGLFSGAGMDTSVDVDASNERTGNRSENDNDVDVENNYDLDIDNDADLNSTVVVTANTGRNEQSRNTTAGDLKTGKVEVSTKVENHANNGSGVSGAAKGSTKVEADLSNKTTGNNSSNENSVDVENNVDIDMENDATVNDTVVVDANTGDNEQSRNTTGGDIETGSVSINFESSTTVNSSSH